jgi:hypothetical protein
MHCDRTTQDDAKRTIVIERKIIPQFENTELAGELNEVQRDLKGGTRAECYDEVFPASLLGPALALGFEAVLHVEIHEPTVGSDLDRPLLVEIDKTIIWFREVRLKFVQVRYRRAEALHRCRYYVDEIARATASDMCTQSTTADRLT